MIRIVLDTNILISGVLYIGKPRRLIRAAMSGKVDSVSSLPIINEFNRVIIREKFKLSNPEQESRKYFISVLSEIVTVNSNFNVILEDPTDDIIIRTAYDGYADYIVSGDWHLRRLGEFAGIRIVTASQMLDIISD